MNHKPQSHYKSHRDEVWCTIPNELASNFHSLGINQNPTMSSKWLCGVLVLLAVSYGVCGQGMSEEEKEEILNAHNHYRGQVDPVATNMLKMVS